MTPKRYGSLLQGATYPLQNSRLGALMIRKELLDIFVDQKLISSAQATTATDEQKKSGEPIISLLLKQNLITKNDIARGLALQVGLPLIEKITEQMADTTLLGKVPLKFLRQHIVMPVVFEGQKTIITANPRDLQPLDDLALLMSGEIGYAVSTPDIILEAINKYYPLESSKEMMDELKSEGDDDEFDLGSIEEKDVMEMANDAPIVKLVNHMIVQAVKEGASDIHIEPFEKELSVRYRIDGNMYKKLLPPKRYQGAIVSRIKIMANMNIAEKRLPQGGRIQLKVADKAIDLRVSVLPCNFGERVVMRVLDKTKDAADIKNLNLSEKDFAIIEKTITRPNGIILVSGPTGSGKTTSLYAILNYLNKPDVNIITVEDPVEYTISGISQVAVNDKIGLTFAAALREILRQDPDICLIGEIRDAETAQIATQAALTGHLVMSTIHTNSAPATITRLIDMGIEPFLVASSLIMVISQRLVRRLCNPCKQIFQPDSTMIARAGITAEQAKTMKFYKAVGCDECLQTGYRGRLPIFEVMEVNDEIAKLIVQRVDSSVIKDKAISMGMSLLGIDGIRCINEGTTTLDEVMAVSYVEEA
jgi:general secretion pathway protein E